jgi:hypothetical protein
MTNEDRAQAIAEEGRRLRYLRMLVDLTSNLLVQGHMSRDEAETLVAATRKQTLELFPDKEFTFDLILAPRFARLMDEFVGPAADAKVVPFRKS